MTIKLSTLSGGGVFRSRFASLRQSQAAGVTGDIIIITAPAGQVAKLTHCSTGTLSTQAGITLSNDGVNVATTKTLSDLAQSSTAVDTFFVGVPFVASNNMGYGAGAVDVIIGEEIKILKNAGNTTEAIEYAYQFGVIQ